MGKLNVVLYTKVNCSICEMAEAILENLSDEIPMNIRLVDIYKNDELLEKYQLQIPVIEIDGEEIASGMVQTSVLRKRLQQKMGIISVE